MTPKVPVSADQIDAVVRAFYARIRAHPALGPVFADHVEDWEDHEAKVARFWRNAILRERAYGGNPMMVHRMAGNVKPAHFSVWLGLFDETLACELDPEVAAAWSAMAHRIGRSLRLGLTFEMPEARRVPQLDTPASVEGTRA